MKYVILICMILSFLLVVGDDPLNKLEFEELIAVKLAGIIFFVIGGLLAAREEGKKKLFVDYMRTKSL